MKLPPAVISGAIKSRLVGAGRWVRTHPDSAQPWVLGVVLALWAALLLSPPAMVSGPTYKLGEYTAKAIKAPRALSVLDQITTDRKKDDAENSIPPVYDYDPDLGRKTADKVARAFDSMRDFLSQYSVKKAAAPGKQVSGKALVPILDLIPKELLDEKLKEFAAALGLGEKSKEVTEIEQSGFSPVLESAIRRMIFQVMDRVIVSDKKLLLREIPPGVKPPQITRRVIEDKSEEPLGDFSKVLDFSDMDEMLQQASAESIPREISKYERTITRTAEALVKPNLTFNGSETAQRRAQARQNTIPVELKREKGQKIIGDGEKVTEEVLLLLNEIERSRQRSRPMLTFLGTALAAFLLIAVPYEFSSRNIRKFKLRGKDTVFLFAMMGGSLTLYWILGEIISALPEDSMIPIQAVKYAIPIAGTVMMVRIILNSEVALVFALALSLFTGMLFDRSLSFGLFALVSSVVGAQGVAQASQRNALIKAGLYVSAANVLTVIGCTGLFFRPETASYRELILSVAFAALGGLLSGFLAVAVIPALEWIFSYTTNIKLLELANLNHPLMKELMTRAPGTYNHSTLTASLAEVGAESLGRANPLLTKVAALYHDVGKVAKPSYFIENQLDEESRHDKLFPRMSGLIISAHVKGGAEMAREYKLGEAITDIIQQHHGTSLIKFFYHRAKEMENPLIESVAEDDFRYPGPKPQTREAGIVMLADVVEATSRVLRNPTPARIKTMVEDSIDNVFREGQLDECELTLKDLHAISEAFTRLLIGIFHQRIEYPNGMGDAHSNETAG